MSPSMKQKTSLSLMALALILSTSCDLLPKDAQTSADCPVPVHASQAVKDWLTAAKPPAEVLHYLKLIGDEQAAIEAVCE